MTANGSYRIEVAACPKNPGYYRWTVLQDGRPLALPGFAYASAWSAREAARVALHWHLALKPLPVSPDADIGADTALPVTGEARDAASSDARDRAGRAYSPPLAVAGDGRS